MSSPNELRQYLDFAREAAVEAGKITLRYFRAGVAVETKADASPVTIADRETEQFIRARIRDKFPQHGIVGEEFGEENAGAAWRWIIDPIDGTQAFVHGVPLYTVLIALQRDGESVAGVIHNPALGETVAAAAGLGCAHNGAPCRVSATAELRDAWVHTTDYAELCRRRPRFTAALLAEAKWARTWADAHGYLLVATGRADAMLDPVMSLWDIAAMKPIIEEAGGRLTSLDGGPAGGATNALATNGAIHARMLELASLDAAIR